MIITKNFQHVYRERAHCAIALFAALNQNTVYSKKIDKTDHCKARTKFPPAAEQKRKMASTIGQTQKRTQIRKFVTSPFANLALNPFEMESNAIKEDEQQISSTSNSFTRKEIERYKAMYEREREQFEEFQQYSKELEAEMELELKQRDQRISELESAKHRLSTILEQFKTKSEKEREEHRAVEEQLRTRLLSADEQCRELRNKLRAVEQQNDDMERRERIHAQQLIDLSERYDQCLERCAMLEAGMAVPMHNQQQVALVVANGLDGTLPEHAASEDSAAAVRVDSVLEDSVVQLQHQPMDFTTSRSVNNMDTASSTSADTSPEVAAMRERVRLSLDERPSQQLIEQLLRKVEAAESIFNNSSFSASTVSSFYDSPPATKPMAVNGFQRNFNGTDNNC